MIEEHVDAEIGMVLVEFCTLHSRIEPRVRRLGVCCEASAEREYLLQVVCVAI